MKRKNTIKIIIFILVFVFLTGLASDTLSVVDEYNYGYQNIKSFYREQENSLDAVYIGSSNCFIFWNSLLAWKNYGIAVHPYACNSNPFIATEEIIKETRKTQPDAVFIVNINTLEFDNLSEHQLHTILGCMPFSLNKMQLIDRLADFNEIPLSDRLEFYVPLLHYHSRWNLLSSERIGYHPNGLKGSTLYYPYLKTFTDLSSSAYYTKSENTIALPQKLIDPVNDLLDYCKEKNVKILFITVPQCKDTAEAVEQYNAMEAFLREKGFEVIDGMELFDELQLEPKQDFYNEDHTNIHGSIKYTKYLSEYLIDHYGFTDKRGNKAYASWDKGHKKYAKSIAPYTLDFERDFKLRDISLTTPPMWIKTEGNNAVLTWGSVPGADGYIIYRKNSYEEKWKPIAELTETSLSDELDKANQYYYYTVVPFADRETRYYGDFNYGGVCVTR